MVARATVGRVAAPRVDTLGPRSLVTLALTGTAGIAAKIPPLRLADNTE